MRTLTSLALLGILVVAMLGLALAAPAQAANGTWNADANGNWSDTTKWLGGTVAGGAGATANLTFNITGGRTITINTTSRTLGILNIGDNNNTHSYTLAATGGATLTFDNGGSNAQLNQVNTSKANTLNATLPIKLNNSLDIKNADADGLTVAGTITANSAGTKTISNLGAGAGTVTLSGSISDGSGSVAVVQNSSTSKLILSGTNTYTGGTNVSAGLVQFNAAGALPASGNVAVAANASVATGTDTTANALLAKITTTSAGALAINAANSETLDFGTGGYNDLYLGSYGNNTYSGALTPGSAGYLLGGGGGTLTVTSDLTAATPLTVNGNVTLTPATSNSYTSALIKSGTLRLDNPGAMGTTIGLTMQGGTLNLNGQAASWNWATFSSTGGTITDGAAGVGTTAVTLNTPSDAALGAITQTTRTVSLTKTGAGALTLTGSSTFGGDATITEGTLKAGASNVLPSGKGNVILDGGATAAGTLDLNGFDVAVGGLSGTTGAVLGQVVNNATGTAKTLTVGSNNATTEFAGAIKDNNSGTGTVALAKTGTGALALSGTNAYTGATTISGGKLYVNGSLSASPTVTVAAGTTLGGKGTVAGAVTVSDLGAIEAGQAGTGKLAIGNGLTFNGAATAVFGDPSQYGTNPGINVTGNLTASGGADSVVLNVPSFPLGTWHLFGYTGGLNDFSAFKVTLPARATGTLQNPAGYVDLNITAFDYIRWVGGGASPTVWDTVATGNWKLNSDNSATTYIEGDKVVFDNDATGKAVDVATADISPYSITFENTAGAANEYTLTSTASKVITGATGLAVTGGGKLTIDSAMLNSFTGQVSVKSGTLSVGAINNDSAAGPLGQSALPVILGGSTGTLQYTGGGAAGTSTKKFTLAAGGTGAFQIDTAGTVFTLSGRIDGEGSLVKTGDGDLVLSGSNAYGGTTTISAGTIQINAPGAGIPGTSAVSIDTAATLQWNRAAATDNLTLINAITGTGTLKIQFATGATALNTKLVGANGFAGTIQLSNTGGTKDKLNVATVNAPSAAVIIDPGTQVYVGGNATFKSIQVSGTGNDETRGAIRLQTGTLTVTNGVTLMGDTAFGPEGGILSGNISSGVVGAQTLTLGTVSSTGNATINDIIGGGLGTIALTKTAAGTATLLGANTYTGKTSIQAGTLKVSSLNYVASGTWGTPASSSLGVPGNAADGTIDFGATTTTGTLLYTGAGETTDRVVNLAGTTGGGTIDQSGTGLLKFTSDLTATGIGSKTLTLQGSTAATGELSGAIADNTTIGSTLLATAFASGASTVTLTSVDGVSVGASISGTGIADSTTVTAINTTTKVLTLSAVTTGAGVVNQTMTVAGVRNSTSVAKAGTGTWTPTNDNNTYTGATTISGGTLIASSIVDGGPSSLGGGTAITINGAAANNATLQYTGGSVTITRTIATGNTTGNTSALDITQAGTTLTVNAAATGGGNRPTFYKDGPGTLVLTGTADNNGLSLWVRQGKVIMDKTGDPATVRACAKLAGVDAGATVQLGDSSNGDQLYQIVQNMNGTLDMNGQNEAVTEFSSTSGVTTGLLTNTKAATSSTLSINTASTFDGTVTDGASGTGVLALTNNGNVVVNMTNTGNTFTGPITSYGGSTNMITFNSIGDSSTNGIVLGSTTTAGGFKWTGPAVTLNRPVSLAGTTGGGTINSSGAGALNLANTAAIATGIGAKTLTLTGTNTDGNTLAGIIADYDATNTTGLTKSGGAGGSTTKWILSGANTFTGNVTISAGQLWITNSSALGTGTKTVTMTAGSAGNCQLYLDGSGGNIDLASTISFSTSNTSTTGTIFNVAGDNTINGNFSMVAGGGNTHIVSNGGTLTLTGSFTSNASPPRILVLDGTTSGNIFSGILQDGSFAAILEKRGAGAWTLSGTAANTYTGMTTVNGGELDLNKTGVNAVGGDLTILDGTLKFLVSEQIINSSILSQSAGVFNLNGMTETIAAYSNSGGIFTTGAGGHLIGTGATITWSGGTNTINDGGIVEDGHWVVTGGTNTVNGGATGGILQVNAGGTGLEMTGSTITLDSDAAFAGRLLLKGDLTTLASATTAQILSGGAAANAGRIDMDGGTRTFTVALGTVPSSGADLSVSAVIANGDLTKAGAGKMLLTGVNLYAGKTTIMQGVLEIAGSGSIALSPMIELKSGATLDVTGAVPSPWTLASGQTLKGSGTVKGDMAVGNGASLSPGDVPGGNPGTLTHSPGDETWAGGGTYVWELNTVDTTVVRQPAGLQGTNPGFDFLGIAGKLNITATSGQKFVIDITGLNPATGLEGAVAGWDNTKQYEWVIATAGEDVTVDPGVFELKTDKFTSNNPLAPGGKFTIGQDGHNVVLYVPEPATLALLGMGGLGLLLGRKRK